MDFSMSEWTPSIELLGQPILNWPYSGYAPSGPHGYLHIADGRIVYVGITCGGTGRAACLAGRRQSHRLAALAAISFETRHYGMSTTDEARAWERFTIEKAVSEGWDLANVSLRPMAQAGRVWMAHHLPKTFERHYMDMMRAVLNGEDID